MDSLENFNFEAYWANLIATWDRFFEGGHPSHEDIHEFQHFFGGVQTMCDLLNNTCIWIFVRKASDCDMYKITDLRQ